MAKRFTDTEKWKDDWYLSLSNDYRIIWQWLLDNCNHAGICKPSINLLNMMCNTSITESDLISVMSHRVLKINNIWFIPKFLKFQYGNLKSKKPAVISVVNELKKNNLLELVNELLDNDCITITESLDNSCETIKDKDKDKDKDIDISINKSKKFHFSDFNGLPSHFVETAQRQIKSFQDVSVNPDKVAEIWEIFKMQNLLGDKHYNSENDVYKHFISWLKFSKLDKPKQNETRDRGQDILNWLNSTK
jgi:hypothetical protein